MKHILLLIIKFYRIIISPILVANFGNACRYKKTCSEYSLEVVEKFGIIRGLWLSGKRLASCNQWIK